MILLDNDYIKGTLHEIINAMNEPYRSLIIQESENPKASRFRKSLMDNLPVTFPKDRVLTFMFEWHPSLLGEAFWSNLAKSATFEELFGGRVMDKKKQSYQKIKETHKIENYI